MLKISVSIFSQILGVDYPKTSPSLSSLIDSIPEEQSLKCLGRLVQAFGEFAPIKVTTPKSSILHIIAEVEKKLGEVEENFDSLVILYYGIKNTPNDNEIWCLTDIHKKLCIELGYLEPEKIYPYKIFTLVCKIPNAEHITQIKSLINNCLKEAMQSSNAKIINRYIHTLITVFQFVNCDSFGDELLNSLLIRAWSDNSERNKLPPEIPSLIQRLVNAVVSKNSDLFELILQELIKSYGKPNTYLVSNALNKNHDKNINWWDRNKIDPNWWREQD